MGREVGDMHLLVGASRTLRLSMSRATFKPIPRLVSLSVPRSAHQVALMTLFLQQPSSVHDDLYILAL